MSLNINNLLTKLQRFYDPSAGTGKKYTGTDEELNAIVTSSGLNGVTTAELTESNNLSANIISSNGTITVTSSVSCKFSYKIADDGRITIFGNNLSISVSEDNAAFVDVIGISNNINATSKDDKITLLGYDNTVNANDGNDKVSIYGEDNVVKDSEENMFLTHGRQYVVYDDKEFLAYLNNEADNVESATLKYESTNGGIKFTTDNMRIIAQSDTDDKIELVGSNNYIDTSDGADEVSVTGNSNTIVTGTDNALDTVNINGFHNKIVGGDEDKINYNENQGSIIIDYTDTSEHYITINGREYLIERNIDSTEDVELCYELNEETGVITFTGDNVKITAQSDDDETNKDEIIIEGNNNYIDLSVGNDEVLIIGDSNVIVTGEGEDTLYIEGNYNKVQGDSSDKVYYTETSGSITLTPEDESKHYVYIDGYEYLVERNTEDLENISFTYEYTDDGAFEFAGNNFKVISQSDTKDNIKITGNNNYVDAGVEDDTINVIGDNNIIHAGEGDDNVIIDGNNNEAYGDAGIDGVAVKGEGNIVDFEFEDKIITLSADKPSDSIQIGDKKYDFDLTSDALKAEKEVNIVVKQRGDTLIIEADDIKVTAGDAQEDIINFIGNNSQIYAKDKNDKINVKGNNNIIDGWSGDDTIIATGRNNKAYGFLGDDSITIVQTDLSDAEVNSEAENLAEKDEYKDTSNEKLKEIAREVLSEKFANKIDGEFDTNTVNASYYTNIINAQIYTSLHNKIDLGLNEDEKKIEVEGKIYTIKNYMTFDKNNPFKVPRTISYEMIDGQLVVNGDYISVVADDGQDDNIKIIGQQNYFDLGDMDDYIEVQGKYNLIFAGIGNDKLVVQGDENTIQGGLGNDTLQTDGKNSIWNDVEVVSGLYESTRTLTDKDRETTITVGNGLTYTVKINAPDDEQITDNIQFTYSMVDDKLFITGDRIYIIAKSGQEDNIILTGSNCIVDLGDKDDKFESKYGANNTVYGGLGNDALTIYGDSFKAFGGEGKDTIEISGLNSMAYANDEKSTGRNDDLLILNGTTNAKYFGFKAENVSKNLNKGQIIISPENQKGTIKYVDSNGDTIEFTVQSNVYLPAQLADKIYVNYEVVDAQDRNGNPVKQLVVKGSAIYINLPKDTGKSVFVKAEGSNMRIQTFSGDDEVEIKGDNNEVYVGEGLLDKADGQNLVKVEGDANKVYGGKNIDKFIVDGKNNTIYGRGSADEIDFNGVNNNFYITQDGARKGGSLIITKANQPQVIVIKGKNEDKDRAYRISLYDVNPSIIDTIQIPVLYKIDDEGCINFTADNVKIEVLDSKTTPSTDEVMTDNKDHIRLIGSNCFVKGTYGSDILIVKGDNNILDGWYGDDSLVIEEGNNNELRGFDGNDNITIKKGNNNNVNGEDGQDTLDIIEGTGNKYSNVEKVKKPD